MSLVAYDWGSSDEESGDEEENKDDQEAQKETKQDISLKEDAFTPDMATTKQPPSSTAETTSTSGGESTGKETTKKSKEDFSIPNFLEIGLQKVEDYSEPLPLPSGFMSAEAEPEEEILEVEDVPFEPSLLLAQSRKQKASAAQNTEKTKSIGTLFSSLHAPWETDSSSSKEKKTKKTKGAVKIAIPTAPEADSDEEDDTEKPAAKRLKPSESGSGLSSLLPKPKHSITFCKTENPNKPAAKQAQRPLIPHTLTKKKPEPKQKQKEKIEEDEDESVSFFSFVEKPSAAETEAAAASTMSTTMDSGLTAASYGLSTTAASTVNDYTGLEARSSAAWYSYPEVDQKQSELVSHYGEMQGGAEYGGVSSSSDYYSDYQGYEQPSSSGQTEYNTATSSQSSDSLDMEQILRLQGRRGQREEVKFVEVNCDDHLAPSNQWLKQVSEEKAEFSAMKKGGHMPSSQQRKKHQITYLAFQAKERELELRNQWASNRSAARQSASKYGF